MAVYRTVQEVRGTEGLGIACAAWGPDELRQMVDGNAEFVRRCVAYRERLSNVYSARQFLEIREETSAVCR